MMLCMLYVPLFCVSRVVSRRATPYVMSDISNINKRCLMARWQALNRKLQPNCFLLHMHSKALTGALCNQGTKGRAIWADSICYCRKCIPMSANPGFDDGIYPGGNPPVEKTVVYFCPKFTQNHFLLSLTSTQSGSASQSNLYIKPFCCWRTSRQILQLWR